MSVTKNPVRPAASEGNRRRYAAMTPPQREALRVHMRTIASRPRTPEHRANLSRSLAGRVFTAEHRQHLSESHVSPKPGSEHAANIVRSHWGRDPYTPEERREARRRARRECNHRRRAVEAGVSIIKVTSDTCGVCHGPLTSRPFPDPMSTTIGHEPPFSRCIEVGATEVIERPEHWDCNFRLKGRRTDAEIQP